MKNSPCPHLPAAELGMSYRCLSELDKESTAFYLSAQTYGNYLWQQGIAGRALLALTRALYADLPPSDPVLREWPLPYAAILWILSQHDSDDFPGNPRISFQHQATRLRGPRQAQRRARAWAAWALTRKARPNLPGDRKDPEVEPSTDDILGLLREHGHPNEAGLWHCIYRQA